MPFFDFLKSKSTPDTTTSQQAGKQQAPRDFGSNSANTAAIDPANTFAEDSPLIDATEEELRALQVFPGYEEQWHQSNDALIIQVTEEFNAKKGWTPDHPDYLDPNLVKSWALQESGGHKKIFTGGDMMQVNNPGDWVAFKEKFGLTKRQEMTPESSLRAALEWAYYKGEITRTKRANSDPEWHDTQRGTKSLPGYESKFTNWDNALDAYNGGGVANYSHEIHRRRDRGRDPSIA